MIDDRNWGRLRELSLFVYIESDIQRVDQIDEMIKEAITAQRQIQNAECIKRTFGALYIISEKERNCGIEINT